MVSRKFLAVALVAIIVGVVFADDSSTASSSSGSSSDEGSKHPKGLRKGSFKKPLLSPEKFKAVMEIYEKEGLSLEEKNKKVDELAEKYSDDEKKAVEGIKKHAAKRAEMIAKLSDESKAVLKEIRGLKKQEHEALKKVDKKDLPIVLALLGHHKPAHPFFKKPAHGKRGSKSTGATTGEVAATEATKA